RARQDRALRVPPGVPEGPGPGAGDPGGATAGPGPARDLLERVAEARVRASSTRHGGARRLRHVSGYPLAMSNGCDLARGSQNQRTMSGWSAPQVQGFARQFSRSPEGRSWWAFVPAVRAALIDQFVLGVVLGQDRDQVSVAAIEELRVDLRRALARRHKLFVGDEDDVREIIADLASEPQLNK